MKKMLVVTLIIFVLTLFLTNLLAARKDDLQVIKKAVKQNSSYQSGQQVKWFKVLVTDNKTKKDKVKITLPVSLFEIFLKCSEDKNLKINREDVDIDLRQLFSELKKIGPTSLIEICEEEETVKVWLE